MSRDASVVGFPFGKVAGAVLVRLAPKRFEGRIEQAQRDFDAVVGPMLHERQPSFSTREAPHPRPMHLRDVDPLLEVLPTSLAKRYLAMRRDIAMVSRELRGERMPMAHVTVPKAATRYASPLQHMRRLRVRKVTHETELARTFELEDPSGAAIAFDAGQFLTITREVEGVLHRRAYSISSTPSSGVLSITVKRIEDGRVSTSLVRDLREGDWLDVTGPSGSFTAHTSTRGPRQVVLVAGGSGVTPIRSIVHAIREGEAESRVALIYGNRSREDTLFRNELEELARANPAQFTLHQLRETGDASDGVQLGRPDEDTLVSLFQQHGLARADVVLSCGPRPMMDALRGALTRLRFDLEKLREERFDLGRGEERDAAELPLEASVDIIRAGASRTITVTRGKTLLESATEGNIALPFSCQLGGCGACKVRLVEGEVAMEEPNCLSASERADGLVLTCVGRPKGHVKLEVLQ